MISQWEDREPLPESGPCEAVIALLQECLDGEFPWERAEVLSLPVFPELPAADRDEVSRAVRETVLELSN